MNCPQCNFDKFQNDFRVCCAHNHMICKECVENLLDDDVHSCPLCNHENEPLLNNELSNDIMIIDNHNMNFHNGINNRNEFINNDDWRHNEYIVHYLNNHINQSPINNNRTNVIDINENGGGNSNNELFPN